MEARLVGSDLGEDRVLTVVLGGVGRPVVGLELRGWDEADLAVQSSVVEPVDVLEGGELDVVEAPPRSSTADELGLVEPQAPVRQTHVLDNGEEVVTYNIPYRNSTLSGEDLLNRIAECLQRFGPRNTDWIEGYLAGLGYVVHRSNIQRATRALELEDGDHSD